MWTENRLESAFEVCLWEMQICKSLTELYRELYSWTSVRLGALLLLPLHPNDSGVSAWWLKIALHEYNLWFMIKASKDSERTPVAWSPEKLEPFSLSSLSDIAFSFMGLTVGVLGSEKLLVLLLSWQVSVFVSCQFGIHPKTATSQQHKKLNEVLRSIKKRVSNVPQTRLPRLSYCYVLMGLSRQRERARTRKAIPSRKSLCSRANAKQREFCLVRQ